MQKIFFKPFLIFLVVLSIVALFILFRPFMVELIIAAVLVSVFYKVYEKITKFLWDRKYLASFVTCILLLLIILIPMSNLLVYASKKASVAYTSVEDLLNNSDILHFSLLEKMGIDNDGYREVVSGFINDIVKNINNWLVSGATFVLKGTSKFIVSLILIVFTMFFFFVEGKEMARKLILWSPLPNKYDLEIINKFRRVSRTILISVFVTALFQGVVGGLGFLIIGWPFIFVFVIMALLSLIPYIGSAIFYVPVVLYLIFTGQVWQGIFILAWCWLVVSNTDELIRAYLIKGKAEVNPIFIIFSILGGVSMFGFWGVVIGPIMIALAVTIFHIYELEYDGALEK